MTPRRQFVLLGLLLALSLGARLAWLGEPCRSPCRSSSDHILIFDETYYVNAARVIAGVVSILNEGRSSELGCSPSIKMTTHW